MRNHVDLQVQKQKYCLGILTLSSICIFFLSISSTSLLYAMNHSNEGHSSMTMEGTKQVPDVEHPMMQPKMYSKAKPCPNCGMMINMWARTRHSFKNSEGHFTTCSIRCMADMAVNSGEQPTGGQVALYLNPEKMVAVEEASYVIGSTAKGTMTMQSKIAFADKIAAEEFAAAYGGKVISYKEAFAGATLELSKSRMMIDKKRKKTGKIKEPTEQDRCTVCGMPPAKFPKHNSQILTKKGETFHFCSTQCMVNFNAAPEKYIQHPVMTGMAWVTLFTGGMYESAFAPYYVVGSKVHGPMGMEAIPFKGKKNAQEFVQENGGKIVHFPQLTPELIMGGMQGHHMHK